MFPIGKTSTHSGSTFHQTFQVSKMKVLTLRSCFLFSLQILPGKTRVPQPVEYVCNININVQYIAYIERERVKINIVET